MKRALQVILAIALFGATFSGVLSYRELFGHTAAVCPSPGAAGTVLGYPACVYGFFMYLVVAGPAVAGLFAGRRARRRGDDISAADLLAAGARAPKTRTT